MWKSRASTDTLKQKFLIRLSNPELDNTRPDTKALYQIASKLADVSLADKALKSNLQKATSVIGTGAGRQAAGIPFRRRGIAQGDSAVLQDGNEDLPQPRGRRGLLGQGHHAAGFITRWLSDKPQTLAFGLLLVVGLLSAEWLTGSF